MTTTNHYGFTLPVVGGSTNTWGQILNSDITSIDTNIWNAAGGLTRGINAPVASASNIVLTNSMNNIQNIQFSADSLSLVLPPMNVTASMLAGGILIVNNVGSHAFSILAQDASTVVLTSLGVGQSALVQALTNGTANGTFSVAIIFPALAGTPLLSANNLSDVANAATSLSNLGGLSSATAASTYAPLASPTFTGSPRAPTQSGGDSSTLLATTAQVQSAISTVGLLKANNLSDVSSLATTLTNLGFNTGGISTPGSYTLPGGLIIKWGTGDTSGGNPQTITFGAPFPSGIFTAYAVVFGATDGKRSACLGSFSASSIIVYTGEGSAGNEPFTFSWLALGH